MSSPLYAAKVLGVAGDTVAIDLVSVCEAGVFTVSRLFAVSLLYEPLADLVYSRPGVRWPGRIDGPLRSRFTENELSSWAGSGTPGAEEARLGVVRDVAYGGFRNVPPLPAAPDADGLYRSAAWADGDRSSSAAARAFRDAVAAVHTASPPLPPARRPAATMRIQVADPRVLAHLAPGMIWDSYAFDDEGAFVF